MRNAESDIGYPGAEIFGASLLRTSGLDCFRLTFPGSTFSKPFTISKIRASISSLRRPLAAAAKKARGGSLARARD